MATTEVQSFESALREQIESRPKTRRTRAIQKILDAKPSRRRTRILARLERHAQVHVEETTGKPMKVGANGAIDWSSIDWTKLFESILSLLMLILPLFLSLLVLILPLYAMLLGMV